MTLRTAGALSHGFPSVCNERCNTTKGFLLWFHCRHVPLGSFSDIKTGDCIVSFSRQEIYRLKINNGLKIETTSIYCTCSFKISLRLPILLGTWPGLSYNRWYSTGIWHLEVLAPIGLKGGSVAKSLT